MDNDVTLEDLSDTEMRETLLMQMHLSKHPSQYEAWVKAKMPVFQEWDEQTKAKGHNGKSDCLCINCRLQRGELEPVERIY